MTTLKKIKSKSPPKTVIEFVSESLDVLQPDPTNPRAHNDRNIEMIQKSLADYGAARSIVIDETNTILAGNGLVEAARKSGISRVKIVDSSGDEVVAVRRAGLSEAQKNSYKIADNRTNELSDWDIEVLGSMRDEVNLEDFFFDNELSELFDTGARGDTPDYLDEVRDVTVKFELRIEFPTLESLKNYCSDLGLKKNRVTVAEFEEANAALVASRV